MRGVSHKMGAARRLYQLVHSHRRDDGNLGNTQRARNCLASSPERDDGPLQNRGYRYQQPFQHPSFPLQERGIVICAPRFFHTDILRSAAISQPHIPLSSKRCRTGWGNARGNVNAKNVSIKPGNLATSTNTPLSNSSLTTIGGTTANP